MKRICKWFALVLVVLSMLLALGGCGGSNDSNDRNLVGTWVHLSYSSAGRENREEYTFNKDGTGVHPYELGHVGGGVEIIEEKIHWETRVDGERRQLRILWADGEWSSWSDYIIEFDDELVWGNIRYIRQ